MVTDITPVKNSIFLKDRNIDFFNSLLKNSSDFIAIIGEDGSMLYESTFFYSYFGFTEEEVIGQPAFNMVHEDDRQAIKELFYKERNNFGKTLQVDFRHVTKDGGYVLLEGIATVLTHDPSINGILLNSRDITAYKKAEKSLKKRFELEHLINEVSTLFINATSADFDRLTKEALQRLAIFEKADRAYLYMLSEGADFFYLQEEWNLPEVTPLSASQHIFVGDLADWLMNKFEADEVVFINDVDTDFRVSASFLESISKSGTKSFVSFPLMSDGVLKGFYGFDTVMQARNWHTNDEYVLRQLGHIIMGAYKRNEVEKALKANEQLLSQTEIISKSGSWKWIASSNELIFSEGLAEIYGVKQGTLEHSFKGLFGRVSKRDRARVKRQIKRLLFGETVEPFEFRIKNGLGVKRHVLASARLKANELGEPIELVGIVQDITERKDAEYNIVLQAQMLSQINDPVMAIDADFRVTYWNQASERVYKISKEEILGKKIKEALIWEYYSTAEKEACFKQIREEGSWRGEVIHHLKDGRAIPVESSFQVLFNERGKAIGYTSIIREVETKKRYEELSRKARLIVENSPAVLFLLEADDRFPIRYMSDNISQFGYNAQDLINDKVNFLDLVYEEDIANISKYFDTSKTNKGFKAFSGEYRIKCKSGELRWVEDKTNEVYDEKGNIISHQGVLLDITERKLARLALEQSESRYRVLAANIPETNVFLFDHEQRYIIAEGTDLKDWGVYSEIFEGFKIKDVKIKSQEYIQSLVNTCFERKMTVTGAFPFNEAFYEVIIHPILDEYKEITYGLGIVRNITERTKAEEALRQSEEKYRTLVEESSEIIFSIDLELRFSYLSPNTKHYLGYEPRQLIGKSFLDFLHEDDRGKIQESFAKVVKEREDVPNFEYKIRTNAGEYRVYTHEGKLIKDEHDKPRYYVGIARDITELSYAQRQLLEAKDKAEQAATAKTQFLSIMSHEIRTPMNAVIGLSHLLIEDDPRPDQLENLKTLQFSAENLLGLINDILDYNKIESGRLVLEHIDFSFRELMQRIVHSYSYQAREKSIHISLSIDDEIPEEVRGDSMRLSQVINNLLSNAVKFTDKGSVSVNVQLLSSDEKGHLLRFEISDTGIGISSDKLDSIFEAFTQASTDTTRKYGGTGLGLAIVKRLLTLFKSEVTVESELGSGAKFTFDLLLERAENPKALQKQLENTDLKDHTAAKILVVEDNAVNRLMVEKFLRKWQIKHIDHASNGVEALRKVYLERYDLILMDLQMPVMDGFEAAKAIRLMKDPHYLQVPIIALSASSLIEVKDQLEKNGLDDYISKPFNPHELSAKIAHYLERFIKY